MASGKGGVRKSTVSVNLAVALANEGYKVGLIGLQTFMDHLSLLMGLSGQRPK
ncbi:MAG: P-loop NTPase [Saprospiraceae bacterium]|nr:P-loop NTPase [Saprospiraceae bacterium]